MSLDRLLRTFSEPKELAKEREEFEAAKERATGQAVASAKTNPLHPFGESKVTINHQPFLVIDDGATVIVRPASKP